MSELFSLTFGNYFQKNRIDQIIQLIKKCFILAPPSNVISRLLTEDEGCGIPKSKLTAFRIVGGEGAYEGQ